MEVRVNKICSECGFVTCECDNSECCNATLSNDGICQDCKDNAVSRKAAKEFNLAAEIIFKRTIDHDEDYSLQ